jgi:hypothetical protein
MANLKTCVVCRSAALKVTRPKLKKEKPQTPEKQGLRNNTSLPPRAQRRRSIFAYLPSPPHVLALATGLRIAQILPSAFG